MLWNYVIFAFVMIAIIVTSHTLIYVTTVHLLGITSVIRTPILRFFKWLNEYLSFYSFKLRFGQTLRIKYGIYTVSDLFSLFYYKILYKEEKELDF